VDPLKTIILIAGPTGSGKTALGVQLALQYGTSVISADSRQCYREMAIGVARPSPHELQQVHHYFIASHSVTDAVNAAVYAQYAHEAAAEIFADNNVALMVGGTGLYIQAFLEGLDDIPAIPEAVRTAVRKGYVDNGLSWLQDEVRAKDPVWFARGEMQNPHRLLRALEVVEATGRSLLDFGGSRHPAGGAVAQSGGGAVAFRTIKIGLDLPRPLLYERINARVDRMMTEGLLQEVEGLLRFRKVNALDTVGYRELFAYLDGETTLETAVDLIKQHTRNYAKRQLTWFRKNPDMVWFQPDDVAGIIAYVQTQVRP
jgi:tRNA dimethylallyltransferase